MQSSVFVFAFLLGLATGFRLPERHQSIAVKGILHCGDSPAEVSRVRLVEEKPGDLDDVIDHDFSDDRGRFLLTGTRFASADLTPFVEVTHSCGMHAIIKTYRNVDNAVLRGVRKIRLYIPKSHITIGQEPEQVYDLGDVNLEDIQAKEVREFTVYKHHKTAEGEEAPQIRKHNRRALGDYYASIYDS